MTVIHLQCFPLLKSIYLFNKYLSHHFMWNCGNDANYSYFSICLHIKRDHTQTEASEPDVDHKILYFKSVAVFG